MTTEGLIKRGDYWWPADDDWCWKVIHDEVNDIDVALDLFPGRAVCIQAGGNVGVWANHLAQSFERVYTFEPDRDNYRCLELNAWQNVFAQDAALGETFSTGALHKVKGNSGAHWTGEGSDFAVTTIDALQLTVCDLIVLDIEGAEFAALKGGVNTILRCAPVVHFEEKGLGERYYDYQPNAAEAFLVSLGYRVHSKIRKDVIMVPQ